MRPGWALAHNTLRIILWKQGKNQEALSEFTFAAQLEKRDEYEYNAGLKESRLNRCLWILSMRFKWMKSFLATIAPAVRLIYQIIYGNRIGIMIRRNRLYLSNR